MSTRRLGWRAAERRYNHLTAALARKAQQAINAERNALADTVCPDGSACKNPKCQSLRAAALRGAHWREVFALAGEE